MKLSFCNVQFIFYANFPNMYLVSKRVHSMYVVCINPVSSSFSLLLSLFLTLKLLHNTTAAWIFSPMQMQN